MKSSRSTHTHTHKLSNESAGKLPKRHRKMKKLQQLFDLPISHSQASLSLRNHPSFQPYLFTARVKIVTAASKRNLEPGHCSNRVADDLSYLENKTVAKVCFIWET